MWISVKGGRVEVNYFRVKTNVGVMWMQRRRVSFRQVIYLFFNEWTKQMRIQTIVCVPLLLGPLVVPFLSSKLIYLTRTLWHWHCHLSQLHIHCLAFSCKYKASRIFQLKFHMNATLFKMKKFHYPINKLSKFVLILISDYLI